MPDFRIAVLPGDGIGPDVTAEGLKTLRAVESTIPELRFHCDELSVGAGEFLRSGDPLPASTVCWRNCGSFPRFFWALWACPVCAGPTGRR